MSIINDALKKAGIEGETVAKPVYLGKKSGTNWVPLAVLLVLFLVAAPFLTPLVGQKSHDTSLIANATGHRKAQFGMEEAALPARTPAATGGFFSKSPQWILSGIVFSPEDSYCLINGKVVKVGEQVNGAELVRITPDRAVLQLEGREIQLSA